MADSAEKPPAGPIQGGESKPPAASAGGDGGKGDRHRLLWHALIVSFWTIVSRVLGLLRDRLMAAAFGASWVNDAFQIAFLLPNMTRRLFGEGALSSAFVPVFSERLATGKREAAFRTASIVLTRLALGLLIVSALLAVGGRVAQFFFSPSAAGEAPKLFLTMRLSEIMIWYCVLINASAVLMGILNSLGHFTMPAFAPVLLNLAMIGACLFGRHWLGDEKQDFITVVAWAVLLGGVLQLAAVALPALLKGFRFRFSLDASDPGYREVRNGFLPIILGVALFQINLLLDQVIARVFIHEDGPVTMLAYGNRLVQLPWALFSLSLATAALPLLSRYWAEGKQEEFKHAVSTAVRHTLYLAIPSAVGLCLLSDDFVRLFYGTGAFLRGDGEAIHRTGRVVFCFALGLGFYSLNSVLARAIYATKDTITPTRAAAFSVGLNVALNLTLVLGTDMKESGLALASALSGGFQTLLLARKLSQRLSGATLKRCLSGLATIGGTAVVSGLVALRVQQGAQQWQWEYFQVFLLAGAIAVVPPWLAGLWWFSSQLAPLRGAHAEAGEGRLGVADSAWPADLTLAHALFTVAMSSAVMGLFVWTVRDSLPPEGRNFALIFQRAAVPVAAGLIVFAIASEASGSREYQEIKAAILRRRKGKSEEPQMSVVPIEASK